MSGPGARGVRSGFAADGQAAAAACLGVWLLAGTALSAALSWGPPFPVAGPPQAGTEREAGRAELRSRVPAAMTGPVGRPAETPDARRLSPPPRPLDINRADATGLQALPGVGPALAERIVAHRDTHGRFRSPADLLRVPGIGAKRYARLRGLIRSAEAP
ncbi:MAG TPA: helix-hairpin-helix domain-containing protein [Candidatus Methylomirabilis sp.]|nr:helix-hairpin-helix domain-containing protein [Candidatus Methylomirabilis sp.]